MRFERHIAIKAREGEFLSQTKQAFLWARKNRCLDEIFPALSGYRSGVYRLESGERVLIKTSPRLIDPVEGEWPTIKALIEGQLDRSPEGDVDQVPYFMSWCKVALESLMGGEPGQWRQGHALIITGPSGSGKNRLQENIITPLLGSRAANPKEFLFGQDQYGGDVFAAEHLCLSEVPSSQKSIDRVELAETIKQIVANSAQRMRLMRVEPWTVHPFWRLTITLNDDPDKLKSLPLVTDDFKDKVIILHGKKVPMPMPTRSEPERKAFREALKSELPAFAHYLINEYEIPEEMLTYEDGSDASRFGFAEYHHPVIKDGLFDDTPAAELMQLIDMADFSSGQGSDPVRLWDLKCEGLHNSAVAGALWHGRALDLQQLLTGDGGYPCSVEKMARTLFRYNPAATLLGRLRVAEGIGKGVRLDKGDTKSWKGWVICPPRSR